MTDAIAQNLTRVRNEIVATCERYHRDTGSVRLLAVSKTKPLTAVLDAFNADQRDFGENYLQDALPKIEATSGEASLHWHYIGAIQSNKTRAIAEQFDWVHTVSSAKIARRLHEQRPADLLPLQVLIQVNVDQDKAKSGIEPEDLPALIRQTRQYDRLALRGLMTLPRQRSTFEEQRQPFRALKQLLDETRESFQLPEFDQLSMGMSADMEAAIAEGSTWVRIGTAVFGTRES